MNKESEILATMRTPNTGYSRLFITTMSKRLDGLFGLDYMLKFEREYAPGLRDGTLQPDRVDEPDLLMAICDIYSVSKHPAMGIRGKIEIPVSREARYNFDSARELMSAESRESERVTLYFSSLAARTGFFFALPYSQVINRIDGVTEDELKRAIEEGYAQTGTIPLNKKAANEKPANEKALKFVELTDKFRPLERIIK